MSPPCAISSERAIQSQATHVGGQQKIVEARSGFARAMGGLVYLVLLVSERERHRRLPSTVGRDLRGIISGMTYPHRVYHSLEIM